MRRAILETTTAVSTFVNRVAEERGSDKIPLQIMDTLTKLFGSAAKVKVMKLFVFNGDDTFDIAEIAERSKESVGKVRREVSLFEKAGLIKRKVFYKTIRRGRRGAKPLKKKTNGYTLDSKFEFLPALHAFLVNVNEFGPKALSSRFARAGNIKLIIVAGVFTQDPDSRVDLLVVGDGIKKNVLENSIRNVEADMGKEIRYAYFETKDFLYRLGVYDKLIRDILDFKHKKVLNKLGI